MSGLLAFGFTRKPAAGSEKKEDTKGANNKRLKTDSGAVPASRGAELVRTEPGGELKHKPSGGKLSAGVPAAAAADGFLASVPGAGWQEALGSELKKHYFNNLRKFLRGQYASKTIYPPLNKVFSAFELCPLDDVRVVIIGQDPYHGPGQAHGLCFSVLPPHRPPPSLKNIYKEMASDIGAKIPTHGHLLGWAQQGVLMLNTVLTVEKGKANAHKKSGWQTFTTAVIKKVALKKKGIVFICWGRPAQQLALKTVPNKSQHHFVTSSHPSPLGWLKPLSQTKKDPSAPSFKGCKCFSRTNALLQKMGKPEVDWTAIKA